LSRLFLTGVEPGRDGLVAMVSRAGELKAAPLSSSALEGKVVAILFEKPSTRTRLSYEAGILELGGYPIVLRPDEMQLSRGESVGDTARVLSGQVAAAGIRTGSEETITGLAEAASIPVFNMLSPLHHPSQGLADLVTLAEAFPGRDLGDLTVAFVGDGNNVARSLALMGSEVGVDVVVSSPPGYELEPEAGGRRVADPREAVAGADAVYTDVWVSMGDEESADERRAALAEWQLNEELLALAAPEAIVMHCLPAHPGEEITEGLLYGGRQRIWDQAENRRHAQKALLEWLLARP
jgi:ornithine carbamoyltransferase